METVHHGNGISERLSLVKHSKREICFGVDFE